MPRCSICSQSAAYVISLSMQEEGAQPFEPMHFCQEHAVSMVKEITALRQVWPLTFSVDPPISPDPDDKSGYNRA